jgi:hypothetical protein
VNVINHSANRRPKRESERSHESTTIATPRSCVFGETEPFGDHTLQQQLVKPDLVQKRTTRFYHFASVHNSSSAKNGLNSRAGLSYAAISWQMFNSRSLAFDDHDAADSLM